MKQKNNGQSNSETEESDSDSSRGPKNCTWDGTVNHEVEEDWPEEDSGDESSDDEVVELEGDELLASLQRVAEHKAHLRRIRDNSYTEMLRPLTGSDWKGIEKNRRLGYNGQSERTKRRKNLNARNKAGTDAVLRGSSPLHSAGAAMMRAFVSTPAVSGRDLGGGGDASIPSAQGHSADVLDIFTGYLSDLSDDSDSGSDSESSSDLDSGSEQHNSSGPRPQYSPISESTPSFPIQVPPPLKRQRHDVPARKSRTNQREHVRKIREDALKAVQRALKSRRELAFQAGMNGLQAYRARAIQACLAMVVNKGYSLVPASEIAAEGNGFARKWGGRLVRVWVREWISNRSLPASARGAHVKSFSLLSDPSILAEMRSYVRSDRWAMNPQKLADFSSRKMVPDVAKQYLQNIVMTEIPQGLKKYLELELFPRIHLKPANGISLRTAHEANDGEKKGWVFEDEYPLKKKGQGRGVHQSEVICSTCGWLKEASQTLEYGKNYEGYWNGELFVKQLKEKIIPAFEREHGAGYRMLLIVDNSQGHSAYAPDALLTSRMNLRPGGKQAHMRDGWYIRDGIRVCQAMDFPPDHPTYPSQPKGMKQRYLREHCDYTFQTLQSNMPKAMASVDLKTIRLWEHRMIRWMEAYRLGLGAKEAQLRVKEFSSRKYKSHRRVPETLASLFDTDPS
ncbi:hypothetical protein FOMPIDRAFT_41382 [Fomitopsis schrenkii]|uniref:DDE-1 domain-containing protein n=1 Tax=Fomitopsis schrenkii TaxID=2126942 RepID=S8E9D2_FOMSC|nr:hypothetical protein FOMPIDRAFT_41382 [Fomitopsis schrenkii]